VTAGDTFPGRRAGDGRARDQARAGDRAGQVVEEGGEQDLGPLDSLLDRLFTHEQTRRYLDDSINIGFPLIRAMNGNFVVLARGPTRITFFSSQSCGMKILF
jgi:hypothetical protein